MSTNERIKVYMEERGISHAFVADKAGIHKSKFSRMMNGKQSITVEDYEAICEGLRVSPTHFYMNRKGR